MSPKLNSPELGEEFAPARAVAKLEMAGYVVAAAAHPEKPVLAAGALPRQTHASKLAACSEPAVAVPATERCDKYELERLMGGASAAVFKAGPAKYEAFDATREAEFARFASRGEGIHTLQTFTEEPQLESGKAVPAKSPEIRFQAPAPAFGGSAGVAAAAIRVEAAVIATATLPAPPPPGAGRQSGPEVEPEVGAGPAPIAMPASPRIPGMIFAQVEWVVVSEAAPGARPQGMAGRDAAEQVRGMFNRIAPRYDFCNHALSAGFDRRWRRRAVRWLAGRLPAAGQRKRELLDVCCGTGDLSLALTARLPGARIVGADFSHAMLTRAQHKARGRAPQPFWVEADAQRLPWADESVAAVASAFGFRNLTDYQAALAEFRRVLQPGGALAILEFSHPQTPLIRQAYGLYFRYVLPLLGGLLSGSRAPYRYLPDSVGRFPHAEGLGQWIRAAGFERVEIRRFTFGIAVLHLANKPTS